MIEDMKNLIIRNPDPREIAYDSTNRETNK